MVVVCQIFVDDGVVWTHPGHRRVGDVNPLEVVDAVECSRLNAVGLHCTNPVQPSGVNFERGHGGDARHPTDHLGHPRWN